MDLGIAFQKCNQCGAMICPPTVISTKGRAHHKEIINFPTSPDKISDDALMPKDVFDDIQKGNHDDVPDLVKFKGKTYKASIAIRKTEYKNWRDNKVVAMTTKANDMEASLKANAKSVIRTDTDETITLNAERFEAIIVGDDTAGNASCPVCGKELCRWKS